MNDAIIGAPTNLSAATKLAPETIKVRNALIEKFSYQPIEEMNRFIQSALDVETDELKRLGLLAARVYILRQKVLSLKAFISDDAMESPPDLTLAPPDESTAEVDFEIDEEQHTEESNSDDWCSLRMIEPGEVNGVRFFKGTVINAKAEDSARLISSGKAIIVDEEGNPIEGSEVEGGADTDEQNENQASASTEAETIEKNADAPDTNSDETKI